MYWKYSLGFVIASLIQATIVLGFESTGVSSLGANLGIGQLVNHILAGQAAGFLLMVIMQGISSLKGVSPWLIGSIYGLVIWAILIPINVAQDTINAPWTQGVATLMASLIAFGIYGIVATYTVKVVASNQIRST